MTRTEILVSETEGSKQATLNPDFWNDPDSVPAFYSLQIPPQIHLRLIFSSPPPPSKWKNLPPESTVLLNHTIVILIIN
jgi:hypothetical protein